MSEPLLTLDAIPPQEVALKAEQLGVDKVAKPLLSVLALSVLAGAFIALGAIFSSTVAVGAGEFPFGVTKLLSGVTFSLGLILVVIAGAELFTGNNLIVMAWASRRVTTLQLLRNWLIVFLGNFVGAVSTAALLFLSGQYEFAGGKVGAAALAIAEHKSTLGFSQALVLGVLCNALVCLAVWLAMSARSLTDKVIAIVPPIAAFVAAGFEHSIANMYFMSLGMMIKEGASAGFWETIHSSPTAFQNITTSNFLIGNLLPVTIGNILGGAGLVAAVYWFIYLRGRRKSST